MERNIHLISCDRCHVTAVADYTQWAPSAEWEKVQVERADNGNRYEPKQMLLCPDCAKEYWRAVRGFMGFTAYELGLVDLRKEGCAKEEEHE